MSLRRERNELRLPLLPLLLLLFLLSPRIVLIPTVAETRDLTFLGVLLCLLSS